MGETLQDVTLWGGVRAFARALVRTWPRRIALATVLLALIIVTAFGGFSTVPVPIARLSAGQAFTFGPAQAHFDSFFVSDSVEKSSLPQGATAWLGLIGTLTVTDDDGWTMPRNMISIDGLGEGEFTKAELPDGSPLLTLEPGVSQQVIFFFPLSDPAAVGDEVEITIPTVERVLSFFDQEYVWRTQDAKSVMAVPRTEEVPAGLIEDDSL